MIRQRYPRSETPPGAKQKAIASFPPPEMRVGRRRKESHALRSGIGFAYETVRLLLSFLEDL